MLKKIYWFVRAVFCLCAVAGLSFLGALLGIRDFVALLGIKDVKGMWSIISRAFIWFLDILFREDPECLIWGMIFLCVVFPSFFVVLWLFFHKEVNDCEVMQNWLPFDECRLSAFNKFCLYYGRVFFQFCFIIFVFFCFCFVSTGYYLLFCFVPTGYIGYWLLFFGDLYLGGGFNFIVIELPFIITSHCFGELDKGLVLLKDENNSESSGQRTNPTVFYRLFSLCFIVMVFVVSFVTSFISVCGFLLGGPMIISLKFRRLTMPILILILIGILILFCRFVRWVLLSLESISNFAFGKSYLRKMSDTRKEVKTTELLFLCKKLLFSKLFSWLFLRWLMTLCLVLFVAYAHFQSKFSSVTACGFILLLVPGVCYLGFLIRLARSLLCC